MASVGGYVSTTTSFRLRPTLETLVRPYTLLILGGGLSFLAWAIPWGSVVPAGVRGFAHSETWTLDGMLFLLAWYGCFFVVTAAGFHVGRRIPALARAERVPWQSYYVFLSILSLLGTIYSYGYVFAKSPHVIGAALEHQQFNEVRRILPEAAGVQTLRYAACLAGAVAIFELGRRRLRALHVLNVVLLLMSAAIASRLSLVIATIVLAGLTARHLQSTPVSPRRLSGVVLLGAVALFLVLAGLNYSRNAYFYRLNGVTNPLVMNVDEIVRYLGIPFQVGVAVANHVAQFPEAPATVAAGTRTFLLPTYLTSNVPASVAHAELRYRSLVSIPPTQSTNSVLAQAYPVFGLYAFPLLGFVAFVAAFIAGHASRYRSYAFIAGLVIAYCFSEWWRVYMFNQGIVQFLVLAVAFWGVSGSNADRLTRGRWTQLTHLLLPETPR
jgi:hypothetical protein